MRSILYNYLQITKEFFRKSKRLIAFATSVFFVGLLIGIYFYHVDAESASKIAQVVIGKFQGMDEVMRDLGTSGRIWMIFWNNLRVVLLSFSTGILLGIIPVLILFFNGLFIGIISGMMNNEGINVIRFFIFGILPHGIFEIPAFILGGVMGIKVGLGLIFSPGEKVWLKGLVNLLRDSIVALTIVLPLLALAAVIEMTVTSNLVKTVFGSGFLN